MSDIYAITALHCTAAGADKVWAMLISQADQLVSIWGKRGGALQTKLEVASGRAAAEKQYQAKVKEKTAKGYVPVDWQDEQFGIKATLRAVYPQFGINGREATATATVPTAALPRIVVSHVTSLPEDRLTAMLTDRQIAMAEKVNGVRCPVEFDGTTLTSFNRQGKALPVPPTAARALTKLGKPFMIDGERMAGNWAGGFIMFDLLHWNGTDIRERPFRERLHLLESALFLADLITSAGPTTAHTESNVPNLALLNPTTDLFQKAKLFADLKASGAEGVVFRDLLGPSIEGNSPYEWKHKFIADLDAIVFAVKPGRKAGSSGSIRLGLIRPDDGALIEVCSVRAGLLDADVDYFGGLLARGQRPVVRVTFLPVRTVGISLVEPTTGTDQIRTDKAPADCTTDQLVDILGDDRIPMIAAAATAR